MRWLSGLVLLTAAALPAAAQPVYNWNTTTGNWATAGNWVENLVPASDPTSQLVFAAAAAGYTATNDIGAGTFTLNRLTVNNTGTGEVVVASAAAANSLTFAGATPAFDITGLARVTAILQGTTALRKEGAGTLALTGASTFTAGLTVAAGTLEYAGPTVTTAPTTNGGFPAGTVTSSPVGTGVLTIGAGATLTTDGVNRFVRNGLTFQGTTANPSVIRVAAGEFTTSGAFGGGATAVVNKTGAGLLRIASGSQTLASSVGTLNVNEGTVLLTDPSSNGDFGGNVVVNNGGTFVFGSNPAFPGENPDFPGTTVLTVNAGGLSEFNIGEDFGGIVLNGGTLRSRSANTNTAAAVASVFSSGTLEALTGSPSVGGSGIITKTTAGTVTVTGFNLTSSGALNIQDGVLATNAGVTGTGAVAFGTATTAGTLRYTGTGATVNRPVSAAGLGGTVEVTQAAATYTFSNALSGAGPLVKAGPGTLALTGALGLTGTFTAGAGATLVQPVTASGPFAVSAGGLLAVNSGTGAAPFTAPALSLGGATAVLRLDLNTGTVPAGPLVAVTGTDALTGGGTIRLTNLQPFANGTYQLVDYTGTGITSGYTLETALAGRNTATLQYNTAATRLDALIAVDSVRWGGQTSNVWDKGTAVNVGGTQNFRLSSNSANTNFIDSDVVTFDEVGPPANLTVNLTATVLPASVTVNNTNIQYEIGGAGKISGAAGLSKLGTNTLILATDNDYTGGTSVQAGTLQLGAGGTTGSVTGSITGLAGGTVAYNRSDSFSLANPLGGGVGLTKLGGGTLTVAGTNSNTGPTTVSAGTLEFGPTGSLAGSNTVTVAAGTTLRTPRSLTTVFATPTAVALNGGTLAYTAAQGTPADGALTVTVGAAGATLDVADGFTATFRGNQLLGPTGTLTKTGLGTLGIGSSGTSDLGNILVSGGVVLETSRRTAEVRGLTVAAGGQYQINDDVAPDTFGIFGESTVNVSGGGPAGSPVPGAFVLTDQSGTSTTAGGPVTTYSNPLNLAADATVGVYNGSSVVRTSSLIFNQPVTGPGRLTKVGNGFLTLSNATNTYAGTTVTAGTLRLGAANALPPTAPVQLAGGTLQTGATTGFGSAAGALSVTAPSTVALGTGPHTLTFGSFDNAGFASLTVTGWVGTAGASGTDGRLVFTDASGLTAGVLSNISFTGYPVGAVLISGNELVPVPEPGLLVLVAAGGLMVRRKVRGARVPSGN